MDSYRDEMREELYWRIDGLIKATKAHAFNPGKYEQVVFERAEEDLVITYETLYAERWDLENLVTYQKDLLADYRKPGTVKEMKKCLKTLETYVNKAQLEANLDVIDS